MKIFLKKGTRKHIKWIFILLVFSTLYGIIGINGCCSLIQNKGEIMLQTVPYALDQNKITAEIPGGQHILIQVNALSQKQETATFNFYDKYGSLVASNDFVLLNGLNDLKEYDEDISSFKYSSTNAIEIANVYYADQGPVDWVTGAKVGIGIFLLCCVQYFLNVIKKRYTS